MVFLKTSFHYLTLLAFSYVFKNIMEVICDVKSQV